jgi:hypothetical protein
VGPSGGVDLDARVERRTAGWDRAAPGDRVPVSPVVWALVGLCAVLGLLLRAWLLTHQPLTGDEAVVGLMAKQIRHGHFSTFYWGQAYGGVEPYLVAALSVLFGTTAIALNATASLLAAVSAILVWRVARRLVPPDREWAALAAAAAFWVWPEVALWNSTRELGFRGVTMVAGLASLLLALRTTDRRSPAGLAALGLVLGVGWWSSPEIAYFAIPALGLVILSWRLQESTRDETADAWAHLRLAVVGFVLGAAPWLWTNLHTGFASLKSSSSPSYVSSTYVGRLSIFFKKTLPIMLGLKIPVLGSWLGGRGGEALFVGSLVVILVLCFRAVPWIVRTDQSAMTAWCAVAVLLFPFMEAAIPATSFWQWGQYGVFIVPLVLLVVIGSAGEWLRSRPLQAASVPRQAGSAAVLAVVVVLVMSVTTVASFKDEWLRPLHETFGAGWHDPNRVAEATVVSLERSGVTDAYAVYWGDSAYDLDLLSKDRLAVTDVVADRWVPLYDRVRNAPDQAWLFFSPTQAAVAANAFQTGPGPSSFPESLFLSRLHALGVGYRTVDAGLLVAVVPDRSVTQTEMGLPVPMWH